MELSPFWSDLGNWDSMTTVALCTACYYEGGRGGGEGGWESEKGKEVATKKFLVRSHAST